MWAYRVTLISISAAVSQTPALECEQTTQNRHAAELSTVGLELATF